MTAKTISYWDISQSEAVFMRSELNTQQRRCPAASDQYFGVLYSESTDLSDFLSARCFLELRKWDDYQLIRSFPLRSLVNEKMPVWLQNLALSPDGKWIAVASFCERLYILGYPSMRIIADLQGGEFISGCVFDQNSHLLAAYHTFQGGGYIAIYEIKDGQVHILHERLEGVADTVAAMQFSADGEKLAIWESCARMSLRETSTGRLLWEAEVDWNEGSNDMANTNVVFSRNEKELMIGGDNGSILCLDTCTGSIKRRLATPLVGFTYHIALDHSQNRLWAIANEQAPHGVDLSTRVTLSNL